MGREGREEREKKRGAAACRPDQYTSVWPPDYNVTDVMAPNIGFAIRQTQSSRKFHSQEQSYQCH